MKTVMERTMISRPLIEEAKPYLVLIDRGDAQARRFGRTKKIPRKINNFDAVKAAIERALAPTGVNLQVMRAAGMSLGQQWALIAGSIGLVGVHGAGTSEHGYNSVVSQLYSRW